MTLEPMAAVEDPLQGIRPDFHTFLVANRPTHLCGPLHIL
jgi:hypothetical protein